MSFAKLLIANRGEIAVRVARAARSLGLSTVAVYSDADAGAPHVRAAQEAVRIGPADARRSYLNIEALLEAAARTGADAVHPGYGFLSESAVFARACVKQGLVFVGPSPEAMERVGDKVRGVELARSLGIPTVPGVHIPHATDAELTARAQELGFPLLVKASAGGGGRGMRRVLHASGLAEALRGARAEALGAFGDDGLLLERLVVKPRHVEVQVLADRHGHVVHLGERDCSVQRRHQKLIEESPSPAVTPTLRCALGEAAVRLLRAANYEGAGTVEFLLDAQGAFYFIEVNARVQVEHPVSELVTGVDIVEQQLRIARGEPLSLTQEQVVLTGHAIEARLCAEDPYASDTPQTGRVLAWHAPAHTRVDHAVEMGLNVTGDYDSLLAKVIVRGVDRADALQRLEQALADTCLLGVHHNTSFLRAVLAHPEFQRGAAHVELLDAASATLRSAPEPTPELVGVAALACVLREGSGGWTSPRTWSRPARLALGTRMFACEVRAAEGAGAQHHVVRAADADLSYQGVERRGDELKYETSTGSHRAHVAYDGDDVWVSLDGSTYCFTDVTRRSQRVGAARLEEQNALHAPFHGRVVHLPAQESATVAAGAPLVVLEAMKMEHVLVAPRATKVLRIHARLGTQVARGQLLIELTKTDKSS